MIPKIIHYCWISGTNYPDLIKHCIDSWHKLLPDYQFVLWDKSKVQEIHSPWIDEAYYYKKYAFIADYVRCYALYHYGGIYLDADVEICKSMNDLLFQTSFIGYDSTGSIEAAIIGAERHTKWLKDALNYYTDRHFVKSNNTLDTRPIPIMLSQQLHQNFSFKDTPHQIQKLKGITLFPAEFFSPKNYQTLTIKPTQNTYTIHHFDGQWIPSTFWHKTKKNIHRIIYLLIGNKGHNQITNYMRNIKNKIR